MSSFLKQATASQARAIGPFVDDTDFKTPETALSIANTDIKLVVNGGASANKNSGGGTHRVNGVYGITFDATDTATVGELEVSVVVAGALPVFTKFTVVEEAVYDALFAASAPGYVVDQPVNVTKWLGGTIPAVNVTGVPLVDLKYTLGTISPATPGTVRADAGDPLAISLPGAYSAGTMGFIVGHLGDTLENNAGTYRFTTASLVNAPTGGSAPTAVAIANEVQTRTIAAVTLVNGLAANTVNASALAADAVTEIQTGLATSAAQTTAQTDLTTIKGKTNSLTFTVANTIDANIQAVNDVAVNGNGSGGTPWGP